MRSWWLTGILMSRRQHPRATRLGRDRTALNGRHCAVRCSLRRASLRGHRDSVIQLGNYGAGF
jgi:hypothetical protein